MNLHSTLLYTHTNINQFVHTYTHRNPYTMVKRKRRGKKFFNAHIHTHTPIQTWTNDNLPPNEQQKKVGRKRERARERELRMEEKECKEEKYKSERENVRKQTHGMNVGLNCACSIEWHGMALVALVVYNNALIN